jgi:uncharacterized protein (DUF433 family)
MQTFPRISHDPAVMGGQPCIQGTRVTVGMIIRQIASGCSVEKLLTDYPYLTASDVREALAYAAWRLETREFDLRAA